MGSPAAARREAPERRPAGRAGGGPRLELVLPPTRWRPPPGFGAALVRLKAAVAAPTAAAVPSPAPSPPPSPPPEPSDAPPPPPLARRATVTPSFADIKRLATAAGAALKVAKAALVKHAHAYDAALAELDRATLDDDAACPLARVDTRTFTASHSHVHLVAASPLACACA